MLSESERTPGATDDVQHCDRLDVLVETDVGIVHDEDLVAQSDAAYRPALTNWSASLRRIGVSV